MKIDLKYGKGTKSIFLPDGMDISILRPRELPVVPDLGQALEDALSNPLGCPHLEERKGPASIAIAVPDETRPVPLKVLLPVLLKRLRRVWPELDSRRIRIVVGGGLHPAPDAAQLERILPEEVDGCAVISHDAVNSPMTLFGRTSRGTPVEINSAYAEAELKIVVGMIDPHQFQGMTGGAKGVVIGCASKNTIQHNHGLMISPDARAGEISRNPARQDINEAGRMIGIDLAINVCLDPEKRSAAVLAGDPEAVLNAGAAISREIYGLAFDTPFDIVIASCGGDPKDICLYQAQKGLNMASQCAVPGGRILLLAACPQGVGDMRYHDYVRRFATPSEQMREFAEQGFRMGAHKAFLFSRTLTRFTVIVDSDMDERILAQCHLRKGDAQPTIDAWLQEFSAGATPRIAIVPNANTTYFHTSSGHMDKQPAEPGT